MATSYFLYESAIGYALFEGSGLDEIGASSEAVQQSVLDIARFGRVVKLTAFQPFKAAAEALAEITSISEGGLTDELKEFIEMNLPKVTAEHACCILAAGHRVHTKSSNADGFWFAL